MSKFQLVKRIELESVSEDWKDCFISFQSPSFADIKKLQGLEVNEVDKAMDDTLNFLKERFIEGIGFDGKEKQPIKKDDLDDMPIEVIQKAIEAMTGNPEKN